MAAQAWNCPCKDRANCIGAGRLTVLELYEYRKNFFQGVGGGVGLRDSLRLEMEGHYSSATREFSR
eukprot:4425321-Pleurochrysis_carterae.AAC.1